MRSLEAICDVDCMHLGGDNSLVFGRKTWDSMYPGHGLKWPHSFFAVSTFIGAKNVQNDQSLQNAKLRENGQIP